jgi:F-type H+-transporting ATPase subunit delta
MSELTTIARPYARAAFDYALEQNRIEDWQSMLVFATEVVKNPSIVELLKSSLSADKVTEIFIQICAEQLDSNGQNLIKVMAENNRLNTLPEVSKMFSELKAEHDKEIEVSVLSAVELDAKQQTSLSASLEKRLARKVKLNCRVDESVVGGLLIKAGDMVIDSTIRGKLDRLTTALKS